MDKIKKGLGRGLSSLIGENKIEPQQNELLISDLSPNKYQPRKIFDDDKFGKAPYIIEYKLGSLAIDTGFGHYNTLVWKLSRLNLAICDNQLQKSSKQSIGILIVVEESLKKAGNFDNGVGTFEQAVEYVQAFNKQWDAPLLLICLKNPQTFQVVDNGRSAPIRSTITFQ